MPNLLKPFKKITLSLGRKKEEKPVSVLGLQRLNQKRTKRVSKRQMFVVLVLILVASLILSIFFLIKINPLTIRNISFKSADLSCVTNEQIKAFLNLSRYNFFNLDNTKLEQQTKEKFICISSIKIIKKIPSTLEIIAEDRKFAAIIRIYQIPELDLKIEEATSSTEAAKIVDNISKASVGDTFIVDAQGVIIKKLDGETNLPLIDYYHQGGELKQGNRLPNDAIEKSLKLRVGLEEQSIPFENLSLIDNGFFIKGEKEIAFSLSKDIDRQLAALQLILHQATIDSKPIKSVDLRFDKAIVVYSAK